MMVRSDTHSNPACARGDSILIAGSVIWAYLIPDLWAAKTESVSLINELVFRNISQRNKLSLHSDRTKNMSNARIQALLHRGAA